ncbi:MAG TPA: hypothetical protein VG248_02765 [Caulobacteraceae bacterium]|nr:hypothetical protein [Caulobacteraceae bacterium]
MTEDTAAELAGLILVVRSLVLAQATREPGLPGEAVGYLAGATRSLASDLLNTIPEEGRSRVQQAWERVFHQCFAVPDGIDLQTAFLRSTPEGGRN